MSIAITWWYPKELPVTVSDILGYNTVGGFQNVERVKVVEKYEGARLIMYTSKFRSHLSHCYPKGTVWIAMEQEL